MEKHVAVKATHRRGKHAPPRSDGHNSLDAKTRHEMIAEAAYYLAEKRGFAPGKELEDWREAESWVDGYMGGGGAH